MITRINRAEPRIQLTVDWGSSQPLGAILLHMKRVGDVQDFAIYAPLEVAGSNLTFQFDELLFSKKQGRYKGKLLAGITKIADVYLEYRDIPALLDSENISV